MPIIPLVCVRGERFSSAAPRGSILVTCTDSSRVISESIVPMYDAARPRSNPIEVMVCLGVRYLKATHFATPLRWPLSPSASRNPACLLLRSCPGLLYRIHEVSIPLACGEMDRPADTPW